jgi:signal transduction histidine kinase
MRSSAVSEQPSRVVAERRPMRVSASHAVAAPSSDRLGSGRPRRLRSDGSRNRVMIIEDERIIRESLGGLLEEEGYEIWFAENGQDALRQLRSGTLPDIIVLDLRMPVMDGWEFRAAQKEDPRLRGIPVIAVSADRSAPAVAISAQAYLRKPLDVSELLRTLDRILFESEWNRMSARLAEAERLASLGRVAAGVGHEINNPLTFAVLNVSQTLDKLKSMQAWLERLPPDAVGLDRAKADLNLMLEMLGDSRVGMDRIGQTVGNLQRLSRQGPHDRVALDLSKVIEQSISMVWNQIRHRARLTKQLADVPPIRGDAAALGQVFLNLLINAAQAIPDGDAESNEIVVATRTVAAEVVIEVRDTGQGIAPEDLPHVFEPFFTTKAAELGTGLGLSISRQTVTEHGGRIEIESEVGRGTSFRVFLPLAPGDATLPDGAQTTPAPETKSAPARARILVIDDEPLMGRVIRAALAGTHDVVVVSRATDAFERLAADPNFDLILCDVVMPDVGGPEVYATVSERWPRLAKRLVFMTGGAFTPATKAFVARRQTPLLAKPFHVDELTTLVRDCLKKT